MTEHAHDRLSTAAWLTALILIGFGANALSAISKAHGAVSDGKEFLRHGVTQHGTLTIVKNGKKYIGRASITVTPRTAKAARALRQHRGEAPHNWGATDLVSRARTYIGQTASDIGLKRTSLWCAEFMNHVLHLSGYPGTGSALARSFARYGRRISGPVVGAIAVMTRGRRGGHVGIVAGFDARGNPIIISGNHNRRVAEAVYPRGRVYAYVMP